ncbi:MAG TPA: alanine--glyoxylate aminotransferase family protein [Chloroflexota bacterium]|nr:alanine--glyoxylate aminotransferase family protein [Chloroflexota bacterium]
MNDYDDVNLRIPGPTPLPPSVRRAGGQQMINHRGPEYAALQAEVLEHLRHFFQTEHEVVLFTASGTGGLEAAIVNTLSPGDRVLAVSIGAFGERFARIAAAYGADVTRLEVPWGQALGPDALRAALNAEPPYAAVLLTANETSTGVLQDVPALMAAASETRQPPLMLVDAISALGAADLPMDALGIDVLVTGSQKVWMAPPGITMLGVSPRAWEAYARARMARFYFDLGKQRDAQKKGQDCFTPAVGTLFALQEGLRLLRAEGLPAVIARHRCLAAYAQRGLEELGFTLFAHPDHRSPTVTAALPPAGVDAAALVRAARTTERLVLGGGQERLAGKIIRLGHMGWVEEQDIAEALAAIHRCLEGAAGASGGAGA